MRSFKQKLYEAIHALVGRDDLKMRLTFAALALKQLPEQDVPVEMQDEFRDVVGMLTRTPLGTAAVSYSARKISDEQAEEASKKILSLFVKASGGL